MADRSLGERVAVMFGGYAAIAVLGVGCIIAPAIGTSPLKPAPLFPLLRTGVEGLGWPAVAGLGVLGLVAGLITRLPVVGIAAASIALLPLAAFAEIAADPTSHNLIPFELLMYLMLSGPALFMALLGRGARSRFAPGPAAPKSPITSSAP